MSKMSLKGKSINSGIAFVYLEVDGWYGSTVLIIEYLKSLKIVILIWGHF